MTTLNSSNNSNVSFGSIYLKGNKDVAKNALGLLPKRVQKNLAKNNEYGLVVNTYKNRDNMYKVTFPFVENQKDMPAKIRHLVYYGFTKGGKRCVSPIVQTIFRVN